MLAKTSGDRPESLTRSDWPPTPHTSKTRREKCSLPRALLVRACLCFQSRTKAISQRRLRPWSSNGPVHSCSVQALAFAKRRRAIRSCRLRPATQYRPCFQTVSPLRVGHLRATGSIGRRRIVKSGSTLAAFSMASIPPIFRWSSRPSLISCSISRPRRRSALKFRRTSSRSPIRSSNKAPHSSD
jgi:hypothetical protein